MSVQHAPLSVNSDAPLVEEAEYGCAFTKQRGECRWQPQPENDWAHVEGVDLRKLRKITGRTVLPDGGAAYMLLNRTAQSASLTSAEAYCVSSDELQVTFKYKKASHLKETNLFF